MTPMYMLILINGPHVESKMLFPHKHTEKHVGLMEWVVLHVAGPEHTGVADRLTEALGRLTPGDSKFYVDVPLGVDGRLKVRCKLR